MSDTHFYPIKIKAIEPATDQAVVLSFDIPSDLKEKFNYQHGQYLTLKFNINGKEERRAYSLCSSPETDTDVKIGVKRVKNGKVSNHINSVLKVGDTVELMPPQGHFTVALNHDNKKDYYLFGGGSGITPLLSILKSVAEIEPKSRVFLLYQNRNEDSIMFESELTALQNRYSGQVFVTHILDEPKAEKKGGVFGMFAKKSFSWTGEIGRVDSNRASKFINENRSGDGRPEEFFLCGPDGLMNAVESSLKNKGVDEKFIHREVFSSAQNLGASSKGGAKVTATISGKQYSVVLQPKETVLEGLMRVNADPPFSCMSGACSTCMAKVVSGSVKMERCLALDKSEVEQGFILTCSSIPTSDEVEITYDV
jgi:ring-1,2-phenylacetyl-CoA epoxidase subunit PaaE